MKINNTEYKTILDSLNLFININNYNFRQNNNYDCREEADKAISLKEKIQSIHDETFSGIEIKIEKK